jgi:signal transduction histidine kinase
MKEQIDKKHNIITEVSSAEDKYPLKDSTRILVYRSIKELAMNTIKHAKANRLIVNLRADKGKLEIIIEDNGIGFEYDNEVTKFKRKGYGLFSVQERVSDMGGTMTIDSKLGEGTKIYISVPLKEKGK